MAISSKILIVEDAESDRVLLREILSDYVNIHETANGMEALTFLQRNPDTDLVLLDLYMPHMDGFEMLACMRLSPWLAHVPVIILTAAEDEATRLKALKMGATEFITKPYVAELLRQRTASILAAAARRKECRPGSFAHQMYDLSQSVHCGISVYEVPANGTTHMLFFSQSYADLCGYNAEEFTAMMENDTLLPLTIYPEDQIIFRQTVETLLTEQQPVYQTLRIQRKDGTVPMFPSVLRFAQNSTTALFFTL